MQFYADDKPVIDKVKNKKEITDMCEEARRRIAISQLRR